MNEQEQAQRLAAWLEDPNATTPEGIDSDVVESVVALRPELGPAPRVSADDILAGVTTGPLAEGLPIGASLAASPEEAPVAGDSDRRRPWWYAALGVGGLSSVAVAAAVLLVVGVVTVNSLGPTGSEVPLAAPTEADAVAMGDDTGGAQARKPSAPARPRPASRPSLAKDAPEAKALEEAVADAESEEADDFVDDAGFGLDSVDEDEGAVIPEVAQERSARSPAPQPRPAPAPMPASVPSEMAPPSPPPADPAPEPESEPVLDAAPAANYASGGAPSPDIEFAPDVRGEMSEVPAGVSRGYTESAPASPAKEDRESERKRRREERQAKREQSKSSPARAPSAAPADEELADDMGPSEVQIARQAIQSGNPDQALPVIEQGLLRYPDDPTLRETLYRLKGDALTALGRIDEAREAYLEAQRLARER